jgi:hypothetical protein
MSSLNRQSFRQQVGELAGLIVTKQSVLRPEAWKPFGHPDGEKSVRNAGCHLSYLAEALEANAPLNELTSQYLELFIRPVLDGVQQGSGIKSIYSQLFQHNEKWITASRFLPLCAMTNEMSAR